MYYDVIIIGSGAAGLFTGLNIDSKFRVAILSKEKVEKSNSNLAQGGIAMALSGIEDKRSHIDDTMEAGRYENNRENVGIMVNSGEEILNDILGYGMNFDKDKFGKLKMAREGNHSIARILHHKDVTGRELIRCLLEEVKKRDNIELIEGEFVMDLEKNKEIFIVKTLDHLNRGRNYTCKKTVLATGGIGEVFQNTTNESTATGDGIVLAYRLGAKIKNLSYIQIHPTALYAKKSGKKFLISEAVRGEGGILRNHNMEAFMEKYHKKLDLAPRDIVSKSIYREMEIEKKDYMYLDIKKIGLKNFKDRFPNIYFELEKNHIDLSKNLIPIVPTQHYVMGGIEVDKDGKTKIDSLYAVGECASTGVHGRNRLASNSLLEALVFGKRAGRHIGEKLREKETTDKIIDQIRGIMNYIDLTEEVRKKKIKELNRIEGEILKLKVYDRKYYELRNLATIAKLILEEGVLNNGKVNSQENNKKCNY